MPAVRSGDKDKDTKTRSRAGCLTCRSRHKKCDETRLDEHRGACRRCFVGAWQCEWPTPPGEKPLKTFVRGVKAASADSENPSKKERFVPRRLSHAESEHRAENEGRGRGGDDEPMTGVRYTAAGPAPVQPYSNTSLEAVAAGFSLPENASAGGNPGHALPNLPDQQPLPNGSLPLPSFLAGRVPLETVPTSEEPPFQPPPPPPPLAAPNPFADLDILAPASSLSAFLRPNVDTNDLTDFFNSLDAEAGFWDSLGGGSSSANGSAGAPSIAESGPSPDAGTYSSGLTPHPNDLLSSSFAPTMPPSTTSSAPTLLASSRAHLVPSNQALSSTSPSSRVDPAPPSTSAAASAFNDQMRTERPSPASAAPGIPTLPVANDEEGPPMVDPVAYNTFNQGFFRSLPKPVREVVVQRAYNAATSSELSRNASMAMVMLYRLRMQQQQQQQDPDFNPSDLATTTEQQARLLAQSNLYFQRAIEHLQAPIPLEAKMVAVLDMQAYQFDQYGAAAANAILLLGEYFINEALGPQPLLDLSAIRDSANVLLTVVAWSDCIRCICIPRRRTLFAFSNLPGEPAHSNSSSTSAVVDDVTSQPYDVNAHQGLPVGLMLCVAATANLACEMDALPDEVVRVKAQGIENAVREWKPPPPDAQDLADSAGYVEKVSTSEMWRHAVIVFLYQVVHRHGPLSKPIRDAVQQILQIGVRMLNHHSPRPPPPASSLSSSSSSRAVSPPAGVQNDANRAPAPVSPSVAYDDYLSAPATRAVPWFLAGTCAILSGDRALCRKGLEVCGKQQGYRDNVMALERLWKIVDERGWVFDWREKLQDEKLLVGFL
ncbi:hypothetical protein C6P46_005646 [Rhodotorula mucilaginosa]|uniref:Zn(2)-C6 fungal-type domain-containing protein n=1 Tax=Rhodotorula mucilaginosa TaxID=5537 RepID=A0A9P7B487_RHOMI|nr:hypothetical protein C6P46_005646 [Rhodotorula mucilaginosa]